MLSWFALRMGFSFSLIWHWALAVPAISTTQLILSGKQTKRQFYKEPLFIVIFQVQTLINLLITFFLKENRLCSTAADIGKKSSLPFLLGF